MVTPVNATDNPVDPESAEEKPKVRAIHRRARLSAVTAPRIWLTPPAPSTPLPPLRSSSTRRTRTSSSRSCSWAGPRSAVPPRTSASSRRRSWRCARGARLDRLPIPITCPRRAPRRPPSHLSLLRPAHLPPQPSHLLRVSVGCPRRCSTSFCRWASACPAPLPRRCPSPSASPNRASPAVFSAACSSSTPVS